MMGINRYFDFFCRRLMRPTLGNNLLCYILVCLLCDLGVYMRGQALPESILLDRSGRHQSMRGL